jgi:hypothetical protein
MEHHVMSAEVLASFCCCPPRPNLPSQPWNTCRAGHFFGARAHTNRHVLTREKRVRKKERIKKERKKEVKEEEGENKGRAEEMKEKGKRGKV